jgi:hypothetical protein
VAVLEECIVALLQRLQQQQQGQLGRQAPLPLLQQQEQHEHDTDMYFDGERASPSSAGAAAATAAEPPSKRACIWTPSKPSAAAQLLHYSWSHETVSLLEARYLWHVLKHGRQQPTYDVQLLQ